MKYQRIVKITHHNFPAKDEVLKWLLLSNWNSKAKEGYKKNWKYSHLRSVNHWNIYHYYKYLLLKKWCSHLKGFKNEQNSTFAVQLIILALSKTLTSQTLIDWDIGRLATLLSQLKRGDETISHIKELSFNNWFNYFTVLLFIFNMFV